jgi:hypothetical protein
VAGQGRQKSVSAGRKAERQQKHWCRKFGNRNSTAATELGQVVDPSLYSRCGGRGKDGSGKLCQAVVDLGMDEPVVLLRTAGSQHRIPDWTSRSNKRRNKQKIPNAADTCGVSQRLPPLAAKHAMHCKGRPDLLVFVRLYSWAFSIWGAIFGLQGFGVVYQLLPFGYDHEGTKQRIVNTIGGSTYRPSSFCTFISAFVAHICPSPSDAELGP